MECAHYYFNYDYNYCRYPLNEHDAWKHTYIHTNIHTCKHTYKQEKQNIHGNINYIYAYIHKITNEKRREAARQLETPVKVEICIGKFGLVTKKQEKTTRSGEQQNSD